MGQMGRSSKRNVLAATAVFAATVVVAVVGSLLWSTFLRDDPVPLAVIDEELLPIATGEGQEAILTVPTTVAPIVAPQLVDDDELALGQPVDGSSATRVPVPPDGALVATARLRVGEVDIWASPLDDAPTWSLSVPTEFGGDRHFLVLEEIDDWFKIQLPVRPNGSIGWVPKDAVTISTTDYRVQIDLSDRSLRVTRGDEVVLETVGVIGRETAPTPLGRYYIRDVLPWDPDTVYGAYVVALSAYSEAIDVINGGDAVVAIHGTNRPELMGQAVSLGCIRLRNEDVIALAETVPIGTPVEVVA